MDNYLLLKLVHIICAVVVAGTGAGIAFFMFMANRSDNVEAIAVTTRLVVLADWLFTMPAVVLQFVTGVLLMMRMGYSFHSAWFIWVISLYAFIGACWIPVLFIQYRLRRLAVSSLAAGVLDDQFRWLMRVWTVLGVFAFSAILVIFWLMVFKPFPIM